MLLKRQMTRQNSSQRRLEAKPSWIMCVRLASVSPGVGFMIMGYPVLILKIGEISLMKEMTTRADVMMTEEERAEMEAAGMRPSGSSPTGPTSTFTASGTVPGSPAKRPTSPIAGGRTTPSPLTGSSLEIRSSTPEKQQSPGGGASEAATQNQDAGAAATLAGPGKDKKGRPKMTPEQKAKLKELDDERRKATEERYVPRCRLICICRWRPGADGFSIFARHWVRIGLVCSRPS
jgi:hypothetical protein